MLLSIPPVLLVWAILTFTICLVAYTMQGITDSAVLDHVSSWAVLAVFFLIFLTVGAALHTFSVIWKFQVRSPWVGNTLLFRRRRDEGASNMA